MKDIKKSLTKTVNFENETKKGEKSKVLKVAEARTLEPIIVQKLSK